MICGFASAYLFCISSLLLKKAAITGKACEYYALKEKPYPQLMMLGGGGVNTCDIEEPPPLP